MAAKNDTPKEPSLTTKIPSERQLTVSSIFYECKNPNWPSGSKISIKVPWIRMQGKWLEDAGFEISKPVRIRVMSGCLVLTVD